MTQSRILPPPPNVQRDQENFVFSFNCSYLSSSILCYPFQQFLCWQEHLHPLWPLVEHCTIICCLLGLFLYVTGETQWVSQWAILSLSNADSGFGITQPHSYFRLVTKKNPTDTHEQLWCWQWWHWEGKAIRHTWPVNWCIPLKNTLEWSAVVVCAC